MRVLILGASGGLAVSLADAFLERMCSVDLVTREVKRERVERRHAPAIGAGLARVFAVRSRYSDFDPQQAYDVCIFTPALFSPRPLASMDDAGIEAELEVGLADHIRLTRKLLARNLPLPGGTQELLLHRIDLRVCRFSRHGGLLRGEARFTRLHPRHERRICADRRAFLALLDGNDGHGNGSAADRPGSHELSAARRCRPANRGSTVLAVEPLRT